MPDGLVPVGRLVKAHGLKGHLVVRPLADGSDALLEVDAVTVEHAGKRERLVVREARWQGKLLLLAFDGIPDRTAAERWLGAEVLLDPALLAKAGPGEFFIGDLVGLPVVDPKGAPVGRVVDVETSPVQDWLVVERDGRQHLVPLTAPIARVELDRKQVVVDAPEGLFDV